MRLTRLILGLCSHGLVCSQGKSPIERTHCQLNSLVTTPQWNQASIDFYEKCLHAKAQNEWLGMRLEEDGIEKLKNIP
jgi:hypothetical protein